MIPKNERALIAFILIWSLMAPVFFVGMAYIVPDTSAIEAQHSGYAEFPLSLQKIEIGFNLLTCVKANAVEYGWEKYDGEIAMEFGNDMYLDMVTYGDEVLFVLYHNEIPTSGVMTALGNCYEAVLYIGDETGTTEKITIVNKGGNAWIKTEDPNKTTTVAEIVRDMMRPIVNLKVLFLVSNFLRFSFAHFSELWFYVCVFFFMIGIVPNTLAYLTVKFLNHMEK